MTARRRHAKKHSPVRKAGGFALTVATVMVALEAWSHAFALPVFVMALFVAFAWLGLFAALYAWLHLAALVVFAAWFFVALHRAIRHYRKPSRSLARRRLEAANRLPHRPFDALEDRPVLASAAHRALWNLHIERHRAQLKKLRPPRWGLSLAERDPYALRYAAVILLALGLCFSWGGWGERLRAALDPAVSLPWSAPTLALNAWITPPEYTGLPPVMIATPAGSRRADEVIAVPEGSVLNVHLADAGRPPTLTLNGATEPLTPDVHGDLVATRTITSGDSIRLQRRWRALGAWKIRVVADQSPQIRFAEPPAATERKATRLSFEASDDYGVRSVGVRLAPTLSMSGVGNDPITLPLAVTQAKRVKQVDYQDLTALPWAGLPVQIQLVATDAAGHESLSAPVAFTLPERGFDNPLARALIEARKKLLTQPDATTRNEAANILASMARKPIDYRGDPVVLMALRGGAVRLVLDRDPEAVAAVRGLMWRTAVKIEDGKAGTAQDMLRQAQRDLAEAIDRDAGEAEIQKLIDKLQMSLAQYLQQLATQPERQPATEMERMMAAQARVLTPDDLRGMLDAMRNLSATGSRDAARQQLMQLRQLMENLRAAPPQLSPAQKQMLAQAQGLRDLAKAQQKLLDETFANQRDGKAAPDAQSKLSEAQRSLLEQLSQLMPKQGNVDTNMRIGMHAMESAANDLKRGDSGDAMKRQGEAITALQRSLQALMAQLREEAGLAVAGQGVSGGERDPFGRSAATLMDDGSVKIPARMNIRRAREILDELQRRASESSRPRLERDYIDRLLERF